MAEIDINKKLESFEAKIMARTQVQCEEIAAEVETYRKEELEKYLSDVLGEAGRYEAAQLQEVAAAGARAVYQKKTALKKELFQKREGYCATIFATAEKRLLDFVGSGDYLPFLAQKAQLLGEKYAGEGITLLVRAADLPLGEELRKAFGSPCTVEATGEILLGGLILSALTEGYRVDESLDSALRNQREWFYQNAGMVVTL